MALRLADKVKPAKGFSHIIHILFSALVPALLFVLVRVSFVPVAILVLVLSKWRIFAVRPRFWPALVRANGVDLLVGFGTIVFLTHSHSMSLQLVWTALYIIWQVAIKPRRSTLSVSTQALIGQTYGLMALFIGWPSWPLVSLVVAGWVICYLSARHFFTNFEEPYSSLYSHFWGYFAAALMWLSGHWLIFYYNVVAQPTLLLTVLAFGIGGLYYLSETDKLSTLYRREIVFIMMVVVVVVLVLSDWGDKTI